MQLHRKKSKTLFGEVMVIIIKMIIFVFAICVILFFLSKLDLPAPYKKIEKKIPNEQFKVLK